jgi:hypothetical protein
VTGRDSYLGTTAESSLLHYRHSARTELYVFQTDDEYRQILAKKHLSVMTAKFVWNVHVKKSDYSKHRPSPWFKTQGKRTRVSVKAAGA